MKRNNLFRIVLLCFLTGFSVLSCSDENINQPISENGLSKISGSLTEWNYSNGKTLTMYTNPPYATFLVGKSSISMNGDFSISLSDPPETELKSLFEIESYNIYSNLSISDSSVKGCLSEFLIKLDSTDYFIGEAIPGQNQNTFGAGYYSVKYFYFNKPLSISGKQSYTINDDSIEVVYNLNYPKGWSIRTYRIVEITEIDSSRSFIKTDYNNVREPSMVFKTHIF